jgi:predicted ABC-type ATPase
VDCLHFVNADLIAAGLSPFSPDIAAVKAGKIMLEQIREHVGQRHDFAIETTLAGRISVRLLRDLKKNGLPREKQMN